MFDGVKGAEFPLSHRKFCAKWGVPTGVQPSSFGHSFEQPIDLTVDAPAVPERTGRRATAGGSRSSRQGRAHDRRAELSSLAAELSAAAATIEHDVRPASLATLSVDMPDVESQPEVDAESSVPLVLDRLAALEAGGDEGLEEVVELPHRPGVEVFLTGRREAIPAWEGGPVPSASLTAIPEPVAATAFAGEEVDTDSLRAMVQLEAARAEADVLTTRYESEHAARTDVERRLAEAQDELRFLRAEVQMAGHSKRRQAGPLRRTLRVLTGRGRPMVPANNPKKERLGI